MNKKINIEDGRVEGKTKEKAGILIKTAKEYFNSAKDEFSKKRYNSAVVLYFKSLVALVDLFVLQKTGDTPSSHNERFRITQENFPEVYDLLDKNFPFYQNSYVHKLKTTFFRMWLQYCFQFWIIQKTSACNKPHT